MDNNDNFALVPRPPGALEKVDSGAKRILAGMVADTLALMSRKQSSISVIDDVQLESWYRTGWKYACGLGVAESNEEAVKWYRKAAEQGHMEAQFELGCCYLLSRGVQESWAESVLWFRKAAEAGHSTAQGILGQLCESGEYLEKDFTEAVKWYRRAAEGLSREEYCEDRDATLIHLARCYTQGRGVARDLAEAYAWLKFGAEDLDYYYYSDEANAELASLCGEMSESELADGENRYQRLAQQRKARFGEP